MIIIIHIYIQFTRYCYRKHTIIYSDTKPLQHSRRGYNLSNHVLTTPCSIATFSRDRILSINSATFHLYLFPSFLRLVNQFPTG